MNLDELGDETHGMALRRGWWDSGIEVRIPRLLDWLQEELDELRAEWNEHRTEDYVSIDEDGLAKPEGFLAEAADIYLILQDMVHGVGKDLTKGTRRKLSYNQIRKYRRDKHGDPTGSTGTGSQVRQRSRCPARDRTPVPDHLPPV